MENTKVNQQSFETDACYSINKEIHYYKEMITSIIY